MLHLGFDINSVVDTDGNTLLMWLIKKHPSRAMKLIKILHANQKTGWSLERTALFNICAKTKSTIGIAKLSSHILEHMCGYFHHYHYVIDIDTQDDSRTILKYAHYNQICSIIYELSFGKT